MGLTDEGVHVRAPSRTGEEVCQALAACLPTAGWVLAGPGEAGAVTIGAYGPSVDGWWHLAPIAPGLVGIAGDRTVLRRLAKQLGGPVLSSTVLDSDIALLAVAHGGEFEVLASGDWMGQRVGRARAKASAWLTLAGSEQAVKQLGKLLRGGASPEDGLRAALKLLGVGGLGGRGTWRPGTAAVGTVIIRQVPKPVPELSPVELRVHTPAGWAGVSCDEGDLGEATVWVKCGGPQAADLVVTLLGPAVEQGLVSSLRGLQEGAHPHEGAEVHDTSVSFGEVAQDAAVAVRFSFHMTTERDASVVAIEARDRRTGVAESALLPITARPRTRDGRTRSVRTDWLDVRFGPGTDDAPAWALLTSWLGHPGIASGPDAPLDVVLARPLKMPTLRRFRMAEIGAGRRWERLAGDLDDLVSLSGSPSAHAFIPDEGWTGFDYERLPRYHQEPASHAPRLELRIDRAVSADLAAVDTATAAAARQVDDLVRGGNVLQAVMGRSAKNGHDFYAGGTEPPWSARLLWSLGAHVWLGPELTARLREHELDGVAQVTRLADGCRIDNADGHDLTRLEPATAHLRERVRRRP